MQKLHQKDNESVIIENFIKKIKETRWLCLALDQGITELNSDTKWGKTFRPSVFIAMAKPHPMANKPPDLSQKMESRLATCVCNSAYWSEHLTLSTTPLLFLTYSEAKHITCSFAGRLLSITHEQCSTTYWASLQHGKEWPLQPTLVTRASVLATSESRPERFN